MNTRTWVEDGDRYYGRPPSYVTAYDDLEYAPTGVELVGYSWWSEGNAVQWERGTMPPPGSRHVEPTYVMRGDIEAIAADLNAAPPEPQPVSAEQRDTELLDWLDSDLGNRVFAVGRRWYVRDGYGWPHRKMPNLRAAIDAAISATKSGETPA